MEDKKQFKKEFLEWMEWPEIKKFFKQAREEHPKAHEALIKYLKGQIK